MAELQWTAAAAWSWFALLAVAGQLWPLAGNLQENARSLLPRFATNMTLTASELALAFLAPAIIILSAWLGETANAGLLRQIQMPMWSQFILAFILSDLLIWAIHRLEHHWPLLWRVHRIHHSDTELDVLTTYRQHPLATLLGGFLLAVGTIAVGLDPVGVAAYQLVVAFHNPLHHANISWPVPNWAARAARWLFVTPGQHALHHSALRDETDSNFGQVFSFWDRLAGTLQSKEGEYLRAIEIGLGERYSRSENSIWSQLALPFAPIAGPDLDGDTNADHTET